MEKEPTKIPIKILSYNLNLLPSGVNPVGHRYKSRRLKEFLKCLPDYDIIALQEVFSSPWFGGFGCRQREVINIAKSHGFDYVRGEQPTLWDTLGSGKITDSGLLILSKYPIKKTGSLSFMQRGAHFDAGAAKGIIYALIQIGTANLLVFNTHLQATHSTSKKNRSGYDSIRHRQLLELKTFINKESHFNGKDIPWILTGDFNVDAISRPAVADEYGYVYDNTNIESEEYKHLINLLDPTRRMRDLLKEANYGEHPPTRPPRLEFPSSLDLLFKHKYPQRLDYIFFMSQDTETNLFTDDESNHTVVVPFLVSNAEYSHLSDHYGIQTTLVYEATEGEELVRVANQKKPHKTFSFSTTGASWWTKLWRYGGLLLACLLTLILTYSNMNLQLLFEVVLLVGIYCAYKLYKCFHKRKRKAEKLKRTAKKPTFNRETCIVGEYSEENKEGPAHRSPYSPHSLLLTPSSAATPYENFRNAVRHYGYRSCLGFRPRNSDGSRAPYAWLTYDEVNRRVENFGSGLCNLGMVKGDFLGIFSENRIEWCVSELACIYYSFISIPVYEAGDESLKFILTHSRVGTIVCSRVKTFQLLALASSCLFLKLIIQMEPIEYEEHHLAEKLGIKIIPFNFIEKDGIREPHKPAPPSEDDLATVIFEANTHGEMRGIMLSHKNIMASAISMIYQGKSKLSLSCDDVHYSYFPLRMRVERSMLHLMFSVGASVGFCQEDNTKLFDDIRELKPTILIGVPGVFIRLYRKFRVIVSSWWWPKRVFFDLAYRHQQNLLLKKRDTSFWNRILFSKFAARLGGRVRVISIHSDGLLPVVHKQFLQICLCCPVTQCYLKTSFGVATCSSLNSFGKNEYAGYPMPCNEIKLVDVEKRGFSSATQPERGRIKIRGPNVMMGFYRSDSKTREKISDDGWYLTNEIGQWNPNGTLMVLGHQDGILEPVKGQIVFNKYLEYLYLESSFVQQIYVTCLKFRPLVAIIIPDMEVLYWWAKEHNIYHDFKGESLCSDPRIRSAVLKDLDAIADQAKLGVWEYIKAVYLEPVMFSCSSSTQHTPSSYNLRRVHLSQRFAVEIRNMYKEMGLTIKSKHMLRKSLTLPTYSDQKTQLYIPPIDKEPPSESPTSPTATASPPPSPALDRHEDALSRSDEGGEASMVLSPRPTQLHQPAGGVGGVAVDQLTLSKEPSLPGVHAAPPIALHDWEEEVRMC